MPTTVTASNGVSYHLWQLPDLSAPEPDESISFSRLENELTSGYFSGALYGSNTGLRKWKLPLPTLAGSSVPMPTVTDINGATVSREQYVWNLYAKCKSTGVPFAYRSPRNGQYYLVRFANEDLSYQRGVVDLYSTGIQLRQVRLSGTTIFDPTIMSRFLNIGVGVLEVGDVTASTQNGLATTRLNATASTGYLHGDYSGFVPFFGVLYDVFIVMKMREATFSNNAGLFTAESGAAYLLGTSSGTKFQNLALSGYEYRLNGVLYAAGNQAAPMNTFGIVHLRFASGATMGTWQIGKDRTTAGTYAKADIADYYLQNDLSGSPLPKSDARELTEHLAVKWGIAI